MAFDIQSKAVKVVGAIIGFIVVLAIAGATVGDVFTNLGTVVTEFTNATTGNATLDAIIPVLGILVGLGVVFGLVTLLTRSSGGKN